MNYHKVFKEIDSFYKATINPMPKPKISQENNNLSEYRCTNPQCKTSKLNPATHKKDCT